MNLWGEGNGSGGYKDGYGEKIYVTQSQRNTLSVTHSCYNRLGYLIE